MEKIHCYQCGYCCFFLRVMIIDPNYIGNVIDPNKLNDILIEKPPKTDCPYLVWHDHNSTECKIHNYEIFKHTTCYYFYRNFPGENFCLVGEYIKKYNLDTKETVLDVNLD